MSKLHSLISMAALGLLSVPAHGSIEVLTTTTTLRAIAERVVGPAGTVSSIVRGTQDPHFVEAKPSFLVKAARADLVLAVGLELEVGYIGNIVRGSRNPKVQEGKPGYLEVERFVTKLEVPDAKVDRSQGDLHAFGNPHFLIDPSRAVLVAKGLAEHLAQLDPSGAAGYRGRAAAFTKSVEAKIPAWKQKIAATGLSEVVTYHRSMSYFLDHHRLKAADYVETKPGIPASAKHLMELASGIKQKGIPCILMESFYDVSVGEKLRDLTGVPVYTVPIEVDATAQAKDYESLIDALVDGYSKCIKKRI